MSYILEEKLREAACIGDTESLVSLIAQNVNVNSKNNINGWTPLHWACKRGNEEAVRLLLNNGADTSVENNKGEKPVNLCSHSNISSLLGEPVPKNTSYYTEEIGTKFIPSYIKHAPLNGQIDVNPNLKVTNLHSLPITTLPTNSESLVLKVKVSGSYDPDFIEIELPLTMLTYENLLNVCCEQLGVSPLLVDRVRKLPNTRIRNDADVKRLVDFQSMEIVLKGPGLDKFNNTYQSICTCKDQTILY